MNQIQITNKILKNKKSSPKSYLKYRLYEDLPIYNKKKNKVLKNEFEIPTFSQSNNILKYNYNVAQLKKMCKFYKQKISGNKKELIKRVYNFLKYSYHARIIQTNFRRILVKKYMNVHGPALIKRELCVNETDFLTLNPISTIPHYQFFSFCDKDNFIYGFDICSLYNLFKHSNNHPQNPYNRSELPKDIITNLRKLIKLCKLFNYPIKIKLNNDTVNITDEQKVKIKINSVFQKIDQLGNYTNSEWFFALDKNKLIRYIKELFDIWCYRAQLTVEIKIKICPPHGNPFIGMGHYPSLHSKNITQLRKISINIIDILISRGIDTSSKNLGAFYSLAALTLVNQDAANALPWLYESVVNIP